MRFRCLLPLGLMALIFWLSSQPLPVALPNQGDKVVHGLVFGLLAGLWVWALPAVWAGTWIPVVLGALVAAFWGVLDEIHQYFVPGRTATPGDALADGLGAVLGAVVGWRLTLARGGDHSKVGAGGRAL